MSMWELKCFVVLKRKGEVGKKLPDFTIKFDNDKKE